MQRALAASVRYYGLASAAPSSAHRHARRAGAGGKGARSALSSAAPSPSGGVGGASPSSTPLAAGYTRRAVRVCRAISTSAPSTAADSSNAASPSPSSTASSSSSAAAQGPTFQDAILRLQEYWASNGCAIGLPHNTEVGAGTMNPATFLRALGPEPWKVCYPGGAVQVDPGFSQLTLRLLSTLETEI